MSLVAVQASFRLSRDRGTRGEIARSQEQAIGTPLVRDPLTPTATVEQFLRLGLDIQWGLLVHWSIEYMLSWCQGYESASSTTP